MAHRPPNSGRGRKAEAWARVTAKITQDRELQRANMRALWLLVRMGWRPGA